MLLILLQSRFDIPTISMSRSVSRGLYKEMNRGDWLQAGLDLFYATPGFTWLVHVDPSRRLPGNGRPEIIGDFPGLVRSTGR